MGASSRGWGIIHQTAPLHVTCVPAIHGLPATAGVWISSQPAGAPQRVPSGSVPARAFFRRRAGDDSGWWAMQPSRKRCTDEAASTATTVSFCPSRGMRQGAFVKGSGFAVC